jgi:cysteine desulfurase
LSLSGHKLYGPKGCGALYVRNRTPRIKLEPIFHGGGHERGIRSGTINVTGAVGVGMACEICRQDMKAETHRVSVLRNDLEDGISARLTGVHINGDPEHRLPHTSHVTFEDIDAEGLIIALEDIAVSSGSACTSASVEPSHVLSAMGLDEASIFGSIRFSLGRGTSAADIKYVIQKVSENVPRLRELRQLR